MAPPASPASPSNFLSPCSSLQQFPATRCTVLCVFLCSSYSLCLGFPLPILCLANPFSLRLDSVSPLGAYHIPQLSSCSPQDPYDLECITLSQLSAAWLFPWTWLTPASSAPSSGPYTEQVSRNICGAEPVPRTILSSQVLEVGPCSGLR